MDGKTYIFITKSEGMVYKRLNKNKKNALVLESDNSFYPAYEVKASDILEIWEYACNIGRNDKRTENTDLEILRDMILGLKGDIQDLKK